MIKTVPQKMSRLSPCASEPLEADECSTKVAAQGASTIFFH